MKDLSERGPEIAETKKQKYYPSLTIKMDILPGIKEKVGSTGFLKVKYEVTSVSKYGDGETEIRLELKQGEIIQEE